MNCCVRKTLTTALDNLFPESTVGDVFLFSDNVPVRFSVVNVILLT